MRKYTVFDALIGCFFQRPYEERKLKQTKNGDYIIDTAYADDTGLYETGVKHKDGKWIIVEEYETEQKALKGHERWVKKMDKKPKTAFDILKGNREKFCKEQKNESIND